jgi:hypothetical protein
MEESEIMKRVCGLFREMFTREDEKKLELMSKLVGWKLELSL